MSNCVGCDLDGILGAGAHTVSHTCAKGTATVAPTPAPTGTVTPTTVAHVLTSTAAPVVAAVPATTAPATTTVWGLTPTGTPLPGHGEHDPITVGGETDDDDASIIDETDDDASIISAADLAKIKGVQEKFVGFTVDAIVKQQEESRKILRRLDTLSIAIEYGIILMLFIISMIKLLAPACVRFPDIPVRHNTETKPVYTEVGTCTYCNKTGVGVRPTMNGKGKVCRPCTVAHAQKRAGATQPPGKSGGPKSHGKKK